MHKIKKSVVLTLLFCLLLNTLCFSGVSAAAADTSDYNLKLLYALGIYSANDEMDLVNEPVTRECAASILSVFYGVTEEAYPTKTSIEDVSEYWASGHIMTMIDNGIMSVYEDGLFRPNASVTGQAAVKMLISMLGRDVMAELKGGYPNGYIAAASSCGLLRGVTVTGEAITKGEFTRLLVNALDTAVLEQVTFGSVNEFSYENKKSLLSDKLHIYKATGTVNATDYATIDYASPAPEGRVIIGGEQFECDIDLYGFLAAEVRFYYYKGDTDEIGRVLYAEEMNSDNVVTVDAKDISAADYAAGSFSYIEKDRVKTVSLPSDLIVVFNGKRVTYYNNNHLKPEQGSVRLVKDGQRVTCMIISSEIDYVVDKVSVSDDVVYISDLGGKPSLKCDLENHFITAAESGAAVDITKLKKGDVLSVAADSVDFTNMQVKQDSTVFRIERSTESVSGTLGSIGDDTAAFDGTDYALSAFAMDTSPRAGNNYTAYINYRGEITYFEAGGAEKEVFAIIHQSGQESGLDSKAYLKIYTQDDKMVIAELPKNVQIDGKTYKNQSDALTALRAASTEFTTKVNAGLSSYSLMANDVWQMAKCRIDDNGVVRYIDTIVENAVTGDSDFTFFMSRDKEVSAKKHANGIYIGSGSISGEVGYSDDTIFFETISGTGRTDNTYKIFKGSAYSNKSFAFVVGFCANDLRVCDAVLRVYSSESSLGFDTLTSGSLLLFDKLTRKVNDEGSEEIYVNGWYLSGGGTASIEVDDASLFSGISRGDFVNVATGVGGRVVAVSHYFDCSAPSINWTGSNGKYSAETRISYGEAIARDDNFLLTWFDVNGDGVQNDGDWYEPRTTKNTTSIFIVDLARNRISKAKLEDIRTEKVHGTGDKIAALYTSGRMPTVVIYRS